MATSALNIASDRPQFGRLFTADQMVISITDSSTDFTTLIMENCTDSQSLDISHSQEITYRILYSLLPILMTAFTVIGNTFVIFAICLNKRLSSKHTSILILNLAAADLLVGSGVMPLAIAQILADSRWLFGRVICRLWISADVICCTASIFTLCIISVDRYIGVTRPLAYSYLVTRGRLICAVAMVWTLSIGVLLATVQWSESECRDTSVCQVGNELQYVVHSVIMSFFIPLIIILIVYFKIYQVTRKRESGLLHSHRAVVANSSLSDVNQYQQAPPTQKPSTCILQQIYNDEDNNQIKRELDNGRTASPTPTVSTLGPPPVLGVKRRLSCASMINENSPSLKIPLRIHYGGPYDGDVNKQRKFYRKHKKTAKTLSLVVGAFLLSWMPFFILYLIRTICGDDCIPGSVMDAFTWLGYSNSALNPIIYAISMRTFGDTMRYTLRRLLCSPVRDLIRPSTNREQSSAVFTNDRKQSRYSYASAATTTLMSNHQLSTTFQRSYSVSETTNLSVMTSKTLATPTAPEPKISFDHRLLHPYAIASKSTTDHRRLSAGCQKESSKGMAARLRKVSRGVVMVNRWIERAENSANNQLDMPSPSPPPPDPKPSLDVNEQQQNALIFSNQCVNEGVYMGAKRLSSIRSVSRDENCASETPSDASGGDHCKMSCSIDQSWHSTCGEHEVQSMP